MRNQPNRTASLLLDRWRKLLSASKREAAAASDAFDELIAAYSAPGRHYHAVPHIEALLRLVEEQAARFQDRASVELAIFYHDAVYDIARKDNEAQSARLAEQRLAGLGIEQAQIERVARLIEATAHGVVIPDAKDSDLLRFLDLDLSILAAPRAVYSRYAADIRAEYAVYPDVMYRHGRRLVLQFFLDRTPIYRSADLDARWDQCARDNLRWELAQL